MSTLTLDCLDPITGAFQPTEDDMRKLIAFLMKPEEIDGWDFTDLTEPSDEYKKSQPYHSDLYPYV